MSEPDLANSFLGVNLDTSKIIEVWILILKSSNNKAAPSGAGFSNTLPMISHPSTLTVSNPCVFSVPQIPDVRASFGIFSVRWNAERLLKTLVVSFGKARITYRDTWKMVHPTGFEPVASRLGICLIRALYIHWPLPAQTSYPLCAHI